MSRIIRLALAALLAAPVLATAQNLVANGSFEADAQAAGSWSIQPGLSGWSGGLFGVELRNDVAGAAFDGANFVELDSARGDLISQEIATSAGQLYTVSFAYAAHTGLALLFNGVEVLWNGVSQGVFFGNPQGATNVWSLQSLTVAGAPGSSRLTFRAVGDAHAPGGVLDAVAVTSAVAEPGTFVLMLAGLGAVGFLARRYRKT